MTTNHVVVIEKMQTQHIPALCVIDAGRENQPQEEDFKEYLESGCCGRVAVEGGTAIGFIVVEDVVTHYELRSLGVAVPHRRKGVGTRLVQAVLSAIRAGGKSVIVNAAPGSIAEQFLTALHCEQIAVRCRGDWDPPRSTEKGRQRKVRSDQFPFHRRYRL
ncbi:MAG: hypothetical protein COT71_02895 [Candidatus Andersenbacteria bacterium CG10_big_fil_rev_8_21_14_0_10_54_11]|uniref:N-acetyltransferase domain-containing protein n=1 Tax=Candidatus Andersenbacteria bacterium CG10_big_fil_rev_8_21_14_0_10_54_11 TaxID=1974485 RepID=A0A2M6WZ43_9BACT|nr:MAG: hypothetical protein COT71_02895 [Candidatus Andersenbacteria bacterium CG10_big_fil_rev_8_21_14_0_10_54_11]